MTYRRQLWQRQLSPWTIRTPPYKKGDTADIAYVGKVDGKEFDGGSSDSYNLVIGSGTFIDGFEDGVIGMKTGETKDLNLKFPDSYQSTDLAGKDVVFTVTVMRLPARQKTLTDGSSMMHG